MTNWTGKIKKKKERLLLSDPDFILIGSAYGKHGMANPQVFVSITAHFMRQTNLYYWQIESQSLRTVDGMGRPQAEVEVQAEDALESLTFEMKLKLPDMLFSVVTRGYTPQGALCYAVLSLLGDRMNQLLQKIAQGKTIDTVACETEILYQGEEMPDGAELSRLRRDYRFNMEQVQLELGKVHT